MWILVVASQNQIKKEYIAQNFNYLLKFKIILKTADHTLSTYDSNKNWGKLSIIYIGTCKCTPIQNHLELIYIINVFITLHIFNNSTTLFKVIIE